MDIPVIDMVIRSGWAGRLIVLMLVVLSFVTWAIIIGRTIVMSKIASENRKFKKQFKSFNKISDVENCDEKALNSPMAQLGKAGAMEYRRILEDAKSHTGVKDWSFFLNNQFIMAGDFLNNAYQSLVAPFDKGVFLLAMSSSIAPFLGLLGTVWGIMNSFFDIGNQGSASLPVVAPGIAEALITTVVGLIVAIPALFFYNYLNHKAEKLDDEMDEFRELLIGRLKREIFSLLYSDRSARAAAAQNQNL
ncbi:MAG TPA: MotA/TolQ/ExbB proton channel family protein [Chitinispirillaceae bacterium]|nr:MotA/TolQ/ExbB proton channel family protein [Chitinispirillaceae bacterium]